MNDPIETKSYAVRAARLEELIEKARVSSLTESEKIELRQLTSGARSAADAAH